MRNQNKKILYLIFVIFLIQINTSSVETVPIKSAGISTNPISHYRQPTEEIEKIFKQNLNSGTKIVFTTVPRGLIISFDSSVFFEEGNDVILNSAIPILDKIAVILKNLNNECIIESNIQTENQSNSCYKTLWELSVIRADEICDYLISKGQIHPSLIRSTGYGEFQPFFYAKNEIKEIKNRIDFVIINYEKTRLSN